MAEHRVGDKVRLVKDIREDECDGLIPGHYLAAKGEILVVREIGGTHPERAQRIYDFAAGEAFTKGAEWMREEAANEIRQYMRNQGYVLRADMAAEAILTLPIHPKDTREGKSQCLYGDEKECKKDCPACRFGGDSGMM